MISSDSGHRDPGWDQVAAAYRLMVKRLSEYAAYRFGMRSKESPWGAGQIAARPRPRLYIGSISEAAKAKSIRRASPIALATTRPRLKPMPAPVIYDQEFAAAYDAAHGIVRMTAEGDI